LDRLRRKASTRRAVPGSILLNPMMCDEVARSAGRRLYADQNRILFKHAPDARRRPRIDMTLLVEN
jgi:hypothetical protein